MAISVKDIQEKEFGYQKTNGYNIEEVDDFLDAIADELGGLVRENLALTAQVKKLQAEAEDAKAAPAAEEKKTGSIDDEAYFRNLQTALRESLISSQRIADETTAEARRQAEQTIADAKAEADRVIAEANIEAAGVKAEADSVRKSIEDYRAGFRKLVEEQVQIYKTSSSLFD